MEKEFLLLLVVFVSITVILFCLKNVNDKVEEMIGQSNNSIDLSVILSMQPKKDYIETIKNTRQRTSKQCYSDNYNLCFDLRKKARYMHRYRKCRNIRRCRGRGSKRKCNRRRYCRNRHGWKINHGKIDANKTVNNVNLKKLCTHPRNNNHTMPRWLRRRIRNWCGKSHRRNVTTIKNIHHNKGAYTDKLNTLKIYGRESNNNEILLGTLDFEQKILNNPDQMTDYSFTINDIPHEIYITRYEISNGNNDLLLNNHDIQFFTSNGINETLRNQGGGKFANNSTKSWTLSNPIKIDINSSGATSINTV